MEYHSDRFVDLSLHLLENGNLISVMPANVLDESFTVTAGLTFGGIVSDPKMKIGLMLDLFDSVTTY